MKTILTILLIFVCFGLQAQVKEKWIETDSLNLKESFVFKDSIIDTIYSGTIVDKNYVDNATPNTDTLITDQIIISASEPIDSVNRIFDVTYDDTLLFNNVNFIIKLDSAYATNKSWNWIYNLGKP